MNGLGDHRRWRVSWLLGSLVALPAILALTSCGAQQSPDLDRGQQLFSQKCGTCHTLTGAGTTATVGPNLDFAFKQARADGGTDSDTVEAIVKSQVENPRPAPPEQTDVYMPANLVEGDDLNDVAAYVASVAGVPGIKPPVFQPPEFFATNCGGCHTLAQAGTTGNVGPNLDQNLAGMSAAEISESISDPAAKITPGFPAGVMPENYGQTLTPQQLQQLVAYLMQSVGGGGGGGK